MPEQTAAREIVESWEFPTPRGDPETVIAHLELQMFRVPIFYALEYVVVEGYRELGLNCEKVDALLSDERLVTKLKRFRHGVFHYQENTYNEKIFDLLKEKDTVFWVRDLHDEFEQFFGEKLA